MFKNNIIIISLILFIISITACKGNRSSTEEVEKGLKIIPVENNAPVEKSENKDFLLKKIIIIDTEDTRFIELGIRKILFIDCDLNGNIFVSDGKQVLKFDENGDFIQKIGSSGQGPGEFGGVESLRVVHTNSLSFFDPVNQKILLFNPGGNFEKEIKLKNIFTYNAYVLDNGYFLILKRKENPKEAKRIFYYSLLNEEFNEITTLKPRHSIELLDRSLKFNLIGYTTVLQITDSLIYVGTNMSDQVEIFVYDFKGNLKRIIKQKFKGKKISQPFIDKTIENWRNTPIWDKVKFKYYFPRSFPPFKYFWIEEDLGILIEQYFESEKSDDCIVDWFSLDGSFIKRLFLEKARMKVFKNGYYFLVNEKQSGYSKLDGYKILDSDKEKLTNIKKKDVIVIMGKYFVTKNMIIVGTNLDE